MVYDDLAVYYEMLIDAKPESVIDVGMALMQNGVISRFFEDKQIPDGIKIYGMHEGGDIPPIYNTIYDGIIGASVEGAIYDLMIFLPEQTDYINEAKRIKARHVLTRYDLSGNFADNYEGYNVKKIRIGEHDYGVY